MFNKSESKTFSQPLLYTLQAFTIRVLEPLPSIVISLFAASAATVAISVTQQRQLVTALIV